MSWQLSIGVERVKCTHLDFSYRFFCCTSYFNLSAQNVAVLQEKEPLSLHIKLFISSLIRNECKIKYLAFGRELNSHIRKDFTIKLPVLKKENELVIDDDKIYSENGLVPDWKLMEEIIKNLPYGDRIQ